MATNISYVWTTWGILPSISGRCNCYDGVIVKTVFKTITSELFWRVEKSPRRR
ncbi:MAG TPA: hypothetical protein VN150_15700 [Ochrobactrum sp.]|nr:hypothetical protein [Ochrobactrum sp.]